MSELLESTGYSYSGISDIINEQRELTKELLVDINNEYVNTREKINKLELELEELKNKRGLLVQSFIYAHQGLKLIDEPLTFIDNNHCIDYYNYKIII
jgi:hypothetical protein